jgi:hypothetical protein
MADGPGRLGRTLRRSFARAGHGDGPPPAGARSGGGPHGAKGLVGADGKAFLLLEERLRGQVHLLAALAGEPGRVTAQAETGKKANEIPMIIPARRPGPGQGRQPLRALRCRCVTEDYLHRRGGRPCRRTTTSPAWSMSPAPSPGAMFQSLVPPAVAATADHHPHHSGRGRTYQIACRSRTSIRLSEIYRICI